MENTSSVTPSTRNTTPCPNTTLEVGPPSDQHIYHYEIPVSQIKVDASSSDSAKCVETEGTKFIQNLTDRFTSLAAAIKAAPLEVKILPRAEENRLRKVLDHGFVRLVDCMPSSITCGTMADEPSSDPLPTADRAIAEAARVSYGQGTRSVQSDRDLIRYLMRHWHTTPFEMVEFKFLISCPLFVARQWMRHRTASINEYSARYSEVQDVFYVPEPGNVRRQSTTNKQGGDEPVAPEEADEFIGVLRRRNESAYSQYHSSMVHTISREQARMMLPQNVYTQFYWKANLHNLLHFLQLRADSHAQQEIRVYAEAIMELITPIVPIAMEAFRDYRMDAITLTRLEVEAMRTGQNKLKTTNKREQAEWQAKQEKLGIHFVEATLLSSNSQTSTSTFVSVHPGLASEEADGSDEPPPPLEPATN